MGMEEALVSEHRVGCGHKDVVVRTARQKVNSIVGLAFVDLKCQRQLIRMGSGSLGSNRYILRAGQKPQESNRCEHSEAATPGQTVTVTLKRLR